MGGLWQQFQALDAATQAAVVGVVVSVAVGLAKRLWPAFAAGPREVRFVTAVVLAGVSGYAQGGWPGCVLAILAALGSYNVGRNVLRSLQAEVRDGG